MVGLKKLIFTLLILSICSIGYTAPKRLTTPKHRIKITQEKQDNIDLLQKIEDLEKEIELLKVRLKKLEEKEI